MNKYFVYKELRKELAGSYDVELRRVRELLAQGVATLSGGRASLSCLDTDEAVQLGEAGKIFREEVTDSLRLILERYERNLTNEVANLGLTTSKPVTNGSLEVVQEDVTQLEEVAAAFGN